LPPGASKLSSFKLWSKALESELYRSFKLKLLSCTDLKLVQEPNESEGAFRTRVRERWREQRDLAIEKLRQKYLPKIDRFKKAVERAEDKLTREDSQYRSQRTQTTISFGATVLGALFGRKMSSVGRATTTARGASRTAAARQDVLRATEGVAQAQADLKDIAAEFDREVAELRSEFEAEPKLGTKELSPRKSDTEVRELLLLWAPYRVRGGVMAPSFRLPEES
jgi:molecular chaperone GrpE (heat shock protein)